MNFLRKTISLFLAILIVLCGMGCSDNAVSAIIYYGVNEPPKNIDPQCAGTVTELMLVRNLYEGLMRRNSSGEIVNGVTESYSKNGTVYTFNIKPDAVWSDGTPLTAYDFYFGITRALSPDTNSPNADCLYSIKNAAKVHNGSQAAKSLGVSVIDANTLQIELEFDDPEFLYALTTAPAMPCNKDFFEKSIGKYGMSLDTVLCNGSYKLKKWATEDFAMRIVANSNYSGLFIPKNSAVYFSKNKEFTNLECLDKNYVDIAEIPTTDYGKAKEKGYTLTPLNNKVLLIGIGASFAPQMRDALFNSLITKNDFSKFNPSYTFANTLYPNFFGINAPTIDTYNPQLAKNIFNTEIKKFSGALFPTNTIYYYGDNDIANIVKCIAGHWQQNLGVYINISPTKTKGEAKDYAKSPYGIGVYSIEVNQKNINRYLQNFNINTYNNNFSAIQNTVFNDSYILPISFYGSLFAYSDDLENLKIESTGGNIDFSYVIKKK